MNTAPEPMNSNPQHPPLDEALPNSRLSALVDGELTAGELHTLLRESADHDELRSDWRAYQLIGDALRDPGLAPRLQASQAFLADFHARLHTDPLRVDAAERVPLYGRPVHQALTALPLAANDPVFRWKMVAGLASLAAVVAVSWTMLGTSPTSVSRDVGAGQLALMDPAAAGRDSVAGLAPLGTGGGEIQAVVVNTARGPLIRDAQLEALLAEHRHGGVSALQMPAGFLRNATYDDTGR